MQIANARCTRFGRRLCVSSRAMTRLPEPQREVILLRDYADAEWELVRETMQLGSVSSARRLHANAWTALRREARTILGS